MPCEHTEGFCLTCSRAKQRALVEKIYREASRPWADPMKNNCQICGTRVQRKKRAGKVPPGGKGRNRHKCPHGVWCLAGKYDQGFNRAPTGGKHYCPECSRLGAFHLRPVVQAALWATALFIERTEMIKRGEVPDITWVPEDSRVTWTEIVTQFPELKEDIVNSRLAFDEARKLLRLRKKEDEACKEEK